MRKVLVLVAVGCVSTALIAQTSQPAASGYLLPPKAIVDILDAPPPPTVELSSSGTAMAVLERASMPTIAELAQPMLRLAGVRINPKTNGLHRSVRYRALTIKNAADGTERKVSLPPNPAIGWIGFSPDSTRFAFTQTRENGIELWVGDAATGAAKAITAAQLNNALGSTASPSRAAALRRPLPPFRPAPTSRRIAASPRRCAPTRTC
jgi:hypothetical protein